MKKLLLHICCGPCATSVIESLHGKFAVTGYFFNPNIHPDEEHTRRLAAAREVCEKMKTPFVVVEHEPESFFSAVRGLEDQPENGARCLVCYRLRMARAARFAAEHSFDVMASTLTVGPMKKAALINPVGHEEARRAGVEFLGADWKKKDGYRRSCELSREFGIYRQRYCGCVFSIRETSGKSSGA